MKRKPKDLTREEFIITLDTLYTAMSVLKGRSSMKLFLKDLLTKSELIMIGRRVIIARKLIRGESYDEIGKVMKVGQSTISRVHKWLNDQLPGYENAIKGLEKEFGYRKTPYSKNQSVLRTLKSKYPLHFLLFPKG